MFFSQRNFNVLFIHELGVNLVRGGKLSENRYPEKIMSSVWASIESLRCFTVMKLIYPRLIRASMCLHLCVP